MLKSEEATPSPTKPKLYPSKTYDAQTMMEYFTLLATSNINDLKETVKEMNKTNAVKIVKNQAKARLLECVIDSFQITLHNLSKTELQKIITDFRNEVETKYPTLDPNLSVQVKKGGTAKFTKEELVKRILELMKEWTRVRTSNKRSTASNEALPSTAFTVLVQPLSLQPQQLSGEKPSKKRKIDKVETVNTNGMQMLLQSFVQEKQQGNRSQSERIKLMSGGNFANLQVLEIEELKEREALLEKRQEILSILMNDNSRELIDTKTAIEKLNNSKIYDDDDMYKTS